MARARSPARQKFCTFEQSDRLLHNAPDDLAFILHCGFFAGLRKNEIIQARPDWFDLKAGVLHVLKTETFCPKSKKERTIPLCKEFREFLAHYGLRSPFMLRPEVKQSELGRYRSVFTSQFARYVSSVDASLSWVTPHVMRHTFGSLLAIRNCSIYKIAKWLGDELGTTQKHYAHLLPVDDDIELSAGSSPSSSRATPSEIDFSV